MSFFSGLDFEGMTNRIMCIRRPVWGSPLSMMERIFFCGLVSGARQRGQAEAYHGFNLLLVGALLQSILEVGLRRDVGGIVLVDLFTARQRGAPWRADSHTKLYALSKKVAIASRRQLWLQRICGLLGYVAATTVDASSSPNAVGVVSE